ncbi:MAG: PAAR domain-containing protein [Bryobacteraceae bacterium]|nr:PAAR domain-containing protein [Bryobacteraceae bacterium]MDW8376633.1 PAAR domain-containing protein [Bryobacterales bacterium]
MSGRPAARITDNVLHPLPPVLMPGPGSPNTLIGYLPAWRGVPAAAAAAIQAAKQISDAVIKAAEAATLAAAGTPGAPAAKAAEEATKAQQAAQMSSLITSLAGGADIHMCTTPLPVPPHGPGVVVDGSPTVLINNLPACRMGDTIIEALGPPNKIVKGQMNVLIGNTGSGCSISAGGGTIGGGAVGGGPVGGGAAGSGPSTGGLSTGGQSSGGPGTAPPAASGAAAPAGGGAAGTASTNAAQPAGPWAEQGGGPGAGQLEAPNPAGGNPSGAPKLSLRPQTEVAKLYSASPAGAAILSLAQASAKGSALIRFLAGGPGQALVEAVTSSGSTQQNIFDVELQIRKSNLG